MRREIALAHGVFQQPAKGVTTWGDLHSQTPGLGLEQELVVESYKCTKQDSRRLDFDDVKGVSVATGEVLEILLKKDVCPGKNTLSAAIGR